MLPSIGRTSFPGFAGFFSWNKFGNIWTLQMKGMRGNSVCTFKDGKFRRRPESLLDSKNSDVYRRKIRSQRVKGDSCGNV